MTENELKVLGLTKDAWSVFNQLPIQHPDDQNEFRFHIHALQNMIFAREGIRKMNGDNSGSAPVKFNPIQIKAS
jgi:hypothetical protein